MWFCKAKWRKHKFPTSKVWFWGETQNLNFKSLVLSGKITPQTLKFGFTERTQIFNFEMWVWDETTTCNFEMWFCETKLRKHKFPTSKIGFWWENAYIQLWSLCFEKKTQISNFEIWFLWYSKYIEFGNLVFGATHKSPTSNLGFWGETNINNFEMLIFDEKTHISNCEM